MKVAIRADAYVSLGTGHVMRCIALGQEIKESGGDLIFISYCDSEGLANRLRNEGFSLHLLDQLGSLQESLSLLEQEKPDWVVLDGYHFDSAYQKAVKDAGFRLLVIDDYVRLEHYYADIIVNQNYGAQKLKYSTEKDAKVLLGARYVMLRKEFLKYRGFKRKITEIAANLLITMGGADFENNTLKVLRAIDLIQNPLNIKVVVGTANPHYKVLEREARRSKHNVELLEDVEDMAHLMTWADAAVSAGGSTVWELVFMSLPSLLLVAADNQKETVRNLAGNNIFASTGRPSESGIEDIYVETKALLGDRERRCRMADKTGILVDGKGSIRIIDALMKRPLKILFLGGNLSRGLSLWLEKIGENVFYTEQEIDSEFVEKLNPDMIISYNYRFILKEEIINIPPRGSVNLHISYLPWNRGANPNVWSFLDNTPKGITIHYIDEGIDTGDILFQREIFIDEARETLKSSYILLNDAIAALFLDNWEQIRGCEVHPKRQPKNGTIHFVKDSHVFEASMREKGWDTPIAEFREKFLGRLRTHA